MGDDYSTLQVYTGSVPSTEARPALIKAIIEFLNMRGFIEVPSKAHFHDRVIAIGPAENRPWLAVYDSISDPDEESEFELMYSFTEFVELAKSISNQFEPSVKICMDDSCAVSFELFVHGQAVDKYADSPGIGWLISRGEWTEQQREDNAGQPDVWVKHLGLEEEVAQKLRQTWPINKKGSDISSTRILEHTAEILGWNKYYCMTGYNIGADGVPFNYKLPFLAWGLSPDEFREIYVRKNGS